MIKLQKWLADNAAAPSRRAAEKMIIDQRVIVNNTTAIIGQRVSENDQVKLDGKIIKNITSDKIEVLLYHKPIGEICSKATKEANNTVFDNLPKLEQGRWIIVGRLDVQSSGLLLFTQSGLLAQRLMHPSYKLSRTYKVRVHAKIDDNQQQNLCSGIQLEDGIAKFDTFKLCQSSKGTNQWIEVSLSEGRNRIVRRMLEHESIPVNRLMRLSYGPIELPRMLKPGSWQYLSQQQVHKLCQMVKMNATN